MPITIAGSGTITGISAGGLPDGSITSDDLAAGAVTAAKLAAGVGGKILQVVSTQYETPTTVSQSANTHADMPFSVNITPTTSTSLMLVSFSLMGETGGAPWDALAAFARTISGTRTVVLPSSYGSRAPGIVAFSDTYASGNDNDSTPGGFYCHMFPDSGRPANTNTITYTPTATQRAAATFALNRTTSDTNSNGFERGISWITVMEVAA
ncbi:MAG: hypothetical protein FJ211_10330 [Ignavibacteria bacterium]|nr:hypothetical protein [Ignavibacteria bacterium]